jgi:hypothetical protein
MDRTEIKARFRQETPEVTTRVIADTVLDSWCEEADKNFCAKTRCIVGDKTFSSVIGTASYDLTQEIDNFFDIDEYPGGGVAYNSKRVDQKTIAEWDNRRSSWRSASNGVPVEYVRRGKNIIFNCPASTVVNIKVYSVLISDDFNDDGIIPFNQLSYLEPYHYAIVLFLQGKAKALNAKDQEKAIAMLEYEDYVKWAKKEINGGSLGRIQFVKPTCYK